MHVYTSISSKKYISHKNGDEWGGQRGNCNYTYIYIYTYIHKYTYNVIHIHMYTYISIHIYIYIHVYTSKCTKMREALILGIANFDRGVVLSKGQDEMGNLGSRH